MTRNIRGLLTLFFFKTLINFVENGNGYARVVVVVPLEGILRTDRFGNYSS